MKLSVSCIKEKKKHTHALQSVQYCTKTRREDSLNDPLSGQTFWDRVIPTGGDPMLQDSQGQKALRFQIQPMFNPM